MIFPLTVDHIEYELHGDPSFKNANAGYRASHCGECLQAPIMAANRPQTGGGAG
jgi:hypothetical protein